MKLQIAILAVSTLAVVSCGCSMCCGPYDYHYPAIGGKHERVDPVHGRVGSILSDPLAPRATLASADSNLLPPPPLREIDDVGSGDSLETDDEMDRIKGDLEDITPMDGNDGLPSLEEMEDQPLPGRPINKKTRLDRRRPIR